MSVPSAVRVELLVHAREPLELPGERAPGVRAIVPVRPPVPGDDAAFHGTAPETVALMRRFPARLRLSVERPAGGAFGAQAAAAAALEALVTDEGRRPDLAATVVVDLFAMDARPLTDAVARLREAGLSALLWLGTHRVAPGRFDVETAGLRKLGMPEIHVPAVRSDALPLVSRFLNRIAEHCMATGLSLTAGDFATFGWVDVELRSATTLPETLALPGFVPRYLREALPPAHELPGMLVPFEPVDDSVGAERRAGVARAAAIAATMLGMAESCGLREGFDAPRAYDTAVVCSRFAEGQPVELRRVEPTQLGESGWVGVCLGRGHDHEAADAEFELVPLHLVAAAVPVALGLLGLPAGTGLTIGADSELTIRLPAPRA